MEIEFCNFVNCHLTSHLLNKARVSRVTNINIYTTNKTINTVRMQHITNKVFLSRKIAAIIYCKLLR